LLGSGPVAGAGAAVDRYVRAGEPDVGTCTSIASPCGTVQYAVDMAGEGDRIHVTGGIYPGVQTRNGTTQTVHLTKTVSLLGGYNATFTARQPDVTPSILDAQNSGRVFYIAGEASPVLDGFVLNRGNAEAGGSTPWGGNIWAVGSSGPSLTVTLRNSIVMHGNAPTGSGRGGGVATVFANVKLEDCEFIHNEAGGSGGALRVEQTNLRIEDTVIHHNAANAAGGVAFANLSSAVMTNTVLADNRAAMDAADILVRGAYVRGYHTTLARGLGAAENAVYVSTSTFVNGVLSLKNSIIFSYTRGITVTPNSIMIPPNKAVLDGVLWYGNGENVGGAGLITVTNAYTGDPAFAADGYHLQAGSAAIGRGVSAGILTDIDGESRLAVPDLGADEYVAYVYIPVALRD
ncbi:MAG: hypothetical protein ACP5JG_11995, partial [Anaerolineae bacterium]